MGYQINWDRFGKVGENDTQARGVLAEAFAKTRNRREPDWIDQSQAVHAVNALNNAGAVITWPESVPE